MNNLLNSLKEYFETTPREKVLEDWAKSAEFDSVSPTVDEFLHNTWESVRYLENIQKKQELNMTIQDLIKTYPNDYELGEAVRKIYSNPDITFLSEDRKSYISIEDKWKEIKTSMGWSNEEKDYEILSFYHNGSFYAKGYFCDSNDAVFYGLLRDDMKSIEVNSMRRLSDGAVFRVGNIVKFPYLRALQITKILPTGYICHKEISRYITTVQHA